MRLKQFDTTNCISVRTGVSSIIFGKNGAIALNGFATGITKIKDGDKIAFQQDEENPEDWYLSTNEKGFVLRESGKSGGLIGNNSAFCKSFKEACGFPVDVNVSCIIGGMPTIIGKTSYWGILIHSANWRPKV